MTIYLSSLQCTCQTVMVLFLLKLKQCLSRYIMITYIFYHRAQGKHKCEKVSQHSHCHLKFSTSQNVQSYLTWCVSECLSGIWFTLRPMLTGGDVQWSVMKCTQCSETPIDSEPIKTGKTRFHFSYIFIVTVCSRPFCPKGLTKH